MNFFFQEHSRSTPFGSNGTRCLRIPKSLTMATFASVRENIDVLVRKLVSSDKTCSSNIATLSVIISGVHRSAPELPPGVVAQLKAIGTSWQAVELGVREIQFADLIEDLASWAVGRNSVARFLKSCL